MPCAWYVCACCVQVLKQAAKLLKPDGKILLIEHGRSYYAWLNNNLDKGCQRHREKWGCFWNRDIMAIVKEVRHDLPVLCA